MTPTEAAALLTCCASVDNRKPDADAAKAWAVALSDLRYEDCRDAVVEHYATKRDWIMPADIRSVVRRVRAKRIADDEVIDMPPGLDPDDTAAYARVLAEGRRQLADGVTGGVQITGPERDGQALVQIAGRLSPEARADLVHQIREQRAVLRADGAA